MGIRIRLIEVGYHALKVPSSNLGSTNFYFNSPPCVEFGVLEYSAENDDEWISFFNDSWNFRVV